ncbi:hypothetical protein KFK09_015207 [Dendrobium nobile]|uniref:Uncharacterized protein n=1 Tax=Dendrobium nobile TaxID=94219 RepID=A0A8T3B3U5_DENNO|nr:hypothetical protein KFK09_015207 [Dendrobium nobile]
MAIGTPPAEQHRGEERYICTDETLARRPPALAGSREVSKRKMQAKYLPLLALQCSSSNPSKFALFG